MQKYFLKQLVVETHKYFHSNCVTCTSFTCDTYVWADELRINQLLGAPFFSMMADERTDVATIEFSITFFVIG